MRLLDFINKYCGKKVDFDGHYGPQCVDLFRQYCKDVLEIPHTGGVEGAKDLAENYHAMPKEKAFFCLVNPENGYGERGDAAVWGATPTNKYGHVAIVLDRLIDGSLVVFEQDGFRQDGAKLAIRDPKNIIGYLRPWKNMEVE